MKLSTVCNMKENTLATVVPWLVLSCLALFPVGRLAELPLVLLSLIGVKVFWENIRNKDWEKSTLLFSLFFLCLWIPIIISAPDSYKFSKTASLTIEYLRFYLAGLAVLKYCLNYNSFKLINRYSLIILSFWIVDALIQFFFGTDLFGYVYLPGCLNGVFGHNIKLGLFLSVYSSLIFVILSEKKHLVFGLLLNLLCVIVILLTGRRGGWIMYGVILLGFLAYKWHNNLKMFAASLCILMVCLMTVSTVLYYNSDGFSAKMNTTLKIFNGDEKSVDEAISSRLPIWKTALSMIHAHPINGVGARAFRYAYPEFSKNNDIFLSPKGTAPDHEVGAYHSHQMQLEILSETGVLGGLFFLSAIVVLVWYWRSRSDFQKSNMLPYALSIAAFFFPLNTHFALYSSSWSQVIYWFIPLYFAAGAIHDPLPDSSIETTQPA
jgi:O-antigen ligase